MRLATTFLLLFSATVLLGQVVWTEPAFPTQEDDIKLYFDASEGNGGLEGFTGEVYAHMGLITNESNSPSDWKNVVGVWGTEDARTLMEREGANLYSKTYNITEFHGVQPGDLVESLAFVFRNGDGSLAGRATDGSDIFFEVFPPNEGLLATLLVPERNSIIYEGEVLQLSLQVNKEADIRVSDNGNEIFSEQSTQVQLDIIGQGIGAHTLQIFIEAEGETQELSREYFVLENSDSRLPIPNDISRYGLTYKDQSFGVSLVAPGKEHVFLLCPANEYSVDFNYRMNKDLDGNTFWIEIDRSNFTQGETTYQFLVDGEIKIADPFAKIVLDPWNDDGLTADQRSQYPEYPEEVTSGLVSAFEMTDNSFDWTITNFDRPAKEELVIYEVLMRDFLNDKSYVSLLDTLPYLAELGVNAIELMPINEFEGNQSWGYNPSFHSAIDKYYGTEEELQKVVDKCHELGMSVILDVVFNHAFSQSPFCQLYWDAANFRPTDENPWLNVTARHPFNVGYDFNHESEFTQAWVKEILTRLIVDLNVDGFRFDLSKGLTQFNSGGNAGLMSRYDQSRIDILTDYAEHIRSMDEGIYVILEHFADNDEERELASKGMLLWSNTTFQFAEAAMGYRSDLMAASYKSRGFPEPSVIAYMESHDEERMGFKIKTWGNSSSIHNTKDPWTFSDRIVATSAVYFSIPGPKMLWQFGEVGYDESINRCEDGSIRDECRLSPKPIMWEDLQIEHRAHTQERIAALLYLRNNHEVFHTESFNFRDDDFFKRIRLDGADMNVVTIANFDVNEMTVSPEFQHTGIWYDYMLGEEIVVNDVNMDLDLKPGEFRIYTSKQIIPPGGFFTDVEEVPNEMISVFPNPIKPGGILNLDINNRIRIAVVNSQGQSIEINQLNKNGQVQLQLPSEMSTGLYFIYSLTEPRKLIAKLTIID